MRQVELAQRLGISKSYLSMILSGQRAIPEHLEGQFSELVHKNQLRGVPSKQRVVGSNPSRDATQLTRPTAFHARNVAQPSRSTATKPIDSQSGEFEVRWQGMLENR